MKDQNNNILNYCILYAELDAKKDTIDDYELDNYLNEIAKYEMQFVNDDDVCKADAILDILNIK